MGVSGVTVYLRPISGEFIQFPRHCLCFPHKSQLNEVCLEGFTLLFLILG